MEGLEVGAVEVAGAACAGCARWYEVAAIAVTAERAAMVTRRVEEEEEDEDEEDC